MKRLIFLNSGRRRRRQVLKFIAVVLGTFAVVAILSFSLGYFITKGDIG